MSNMIDNAKASAKRNIDTKIVFSVVVGVAAFGGLMYFAARSGVKPVVAAANIAKGGK